MASYQNRPGAQATDEYGNPIQQLDEYGNPIGRGATGGGGYGTGGGYGGGATGGTYGTGGEGYGAGTGALGAGVGGRHHGQEQLHKESGGGGLGGMLHRSGSGSSSSSGRKIREGYRRGWVGGFRKEGRVRQGGTSPEVSDDGAMTESRPGTFQQLCIGNRLLVSSDCVEEDSACLRDKPMAAKQEASSSSIVESNIIEDLSMRPTGMSPGSNEVSHMEIEALWIRVNTATALLTYLKSKATTVAAAATADLSQLSLADGLVVNDSKLFESIAFSGASDGERDQAYVSEMLDHVESVSGVMDSLARRAIVAESEAAVQRDKALLSQQEIQRKVGQINNMSVKLEDMEKFALGTTSILGEMRRRVDDLVEETSRQKARATENEQELCRVRRDFESLKSYVSSLISVRETLVSSEKQFQTIERLFERVYRNLYIVVATGFYGSEDPGPALQIPILNLKPVFDSQSDLTYRFNSGINLDLIAWWCVETKNTVQGMRKKQKSCVLSPVEKK
ncbi:hypothetical protein Bca52824_094247 [Brassica carinata]|uniref:Uncharacterized protein n=1 Tax=Brassica carinata TaxID=52824 RepID=A0A8X7P3L7_BRACI|nr:hypothetical protein Bca52824_094247 [Brassica carinata]